jgi:hypothetical protein
MTADSQILNTFLIDNGLKPSLDIGEGRPDKEVTGHNYVFDAFRVSVQFWHWPIVN